METWIVGQEVRGPESQEIRRKQGAQDEEGEEEDKSEFITVVIKSEERKLTDTEAEEKQKLIYCIFLFFGRRQHLEKKYIDTHFLLSFTGFMWWRPRKSGYGKFYSFHFFLHFPLRKFKKSICVL